MLGLEGWNADLGECWMIAGMGYWNARFQGRNVGPLGGMLR